MNSKQQKILLVLLFLATLSFSVCIYELYSMDNKLCEFEQTNKKLQIDSQTEIDIIQLENQKLIEMSKEHSKADMYLFFADDCIIEGVLNWELANEDSMYCDLDCLAWSTESYEEANEYFKKSNEIYNSLNNKYKSNNIFNLLNNEAILNLEINQKIDLSQAGIEYTNKMIEYNNKYKLSVEYYYDYELCDKYYNQYLDVCDEGDILLDKYLNSYEAMLELYDIEY